MEKGFTWEKELRQGLFCKKDQRWEVSLRNKGKGRVFWAKSPPFFLLPPDQNRGREWGGVSGTNLGGQGLGGGSGVGEKGERGPRGRFPAAARAEVAWVGLAATRCGGGWRRAWGDEEERVLGVPMPILVWAAALWGGELRGGRCSGRR